MKLTYGLPTSWFLAVLFCFSHFGIWAQSITLNEAIQQGMVNRIELKNGTLNVQLAERENAKIKAQWLPQVTGTADLRWNTQLQTTILPFDITGRNPDGKSTVKFGLPFSNNFGLDAEQKIIDPRTRYDRQLNDTRVETEQNAAEQQQIAVRQSITEAYYLAVFNKEKIKLAEEALVRAQSNLDIAQTKLTAGTLLPNDFDRTRLDKNIAALSLRKARQDYNLALQALRYRMGLPQNNLLELSQTLTEILQDTLVVPATSETLGTPDVSSRAELRAEELNFRTQQLTESRESAVRRPTLSAYGNYSVLQLSENFNPFQSGTWYPFNYLGIRLNVPIFDGRQARLLSGDYRIRQELSRNTLDQLRQDFTYETQNALTTLYQSRLDITDARANAALARQVLETDLFRYEKDVLTLAELNNTQATLQNAENNYLTSVYNYLVALVRYRQAAGLL